MRTWGCGTAPVPRIIYEQRLFKGYATLTRDTHLHKGMPTAHVAAVVVLFVANLLLIYPQVT
jgi:hypothetical protein